MTQPPRRVVRIITRLVLGGPTWHVVNLTRGLAPGYETLLVVGEAEPHEADIIGDITGRGIRVHTIPGMSREVRPLADLRVLIRLYRLMRRVKPAVVHTHTAKAGTVGRLAAFLARVPVRIHTFHGHNFHGYFSPARTAMFLRIERMLARLSSCIIAISPAQADELVNTYRICTSGKIRIIPLGLDLDRYAASQQTVRDDFRRELGVSDDIVVASVGRLVPIKNLRLLLDAAAKALAVDPRFLFVIVGDGEQRQALTAHAQALGIADRVRFLGWRFDLDRIYAGVDLVALTSDNEGTPVCLIEALASGCRVAATDVGGVRDLLDGGRFGTLVPPADADAFAAALMTMGVAGVRVSEETRLAIIRRYAVGRLLGDIGALYDELLRSVS